MSSLGLSMNKNNINHHSKVRGLWHWGLHLIINTVKRQLLKIITIYIQ